MWPLWIPSRFPFYACAVYLSALNSVFLPCWFLKISPRCISKFQSYELLVLLKEQIERQKGYHDDNKEKGYVVLGSPCHLTQQQCLQLCWDSCGLTWHQRLSHFPSLQSRCAPASNRLWGPGHGEPNMKKWVCLAQGSGCKFSPWFNSPIPPHQLCVRWKGKFPPSQYLDSFY